MKITILALLWAAISGALFGQDDPFRETPGQPPVRADQVGTLVEYIQLDDRVANKLARKHAASLSAKPLREELETMLDEGSATLLESSYVKTRSGQRAKVESVDEIIYPTEFDPPEIPQTVTLASSHAPGTAANPTAFDTRKAGTTMEVEPQIDGTTIRIHFAPEVVRYLGREYTVEARDNLAPEDPRGLSSTIYQPRFYTIKISNAVTVRDGDTVLIAVHRPADAKDKMVMVLLRADILK